MGKIIDGVYYGSDGQPSHRGIVQIDDKLYYAGKDGVIVKDAEKIIHHGMANGLAHHGSYYFDSDGVCDLNSFHAVKQKRSKSPKNHPPKINKNHKTAILVVILAAVFVVAAKLLLMFMESVGVITSQSSETAVLRDNGQLEIILPDFDGEVYLCTNTMQKYYQGVYTLQEAVESGVSAYQPFVFEYEIQNADSAVLLLSENDDYSNSMEYELDVDTRSISVDNLKTNTTYYYLVTAETEQGKTQSNGGNFTTADTNRFISFDGVYNTRDIGGYDTVYSKKVKQGVLIRGTELDGLVESTYYLRNVEETESFDFACDFDLRSALIFNTTYVSRLGSNVSHKFYDSPMYGGIFASGNEELLKEIFTDLADKNNYPMYLHCTYGADRTGTIVFLLQGLLGVSEENMVKEYELTGFFDKSYVYGDNINSVYSGLQGVSGDTINEKIENYMIDTIGITEEQIQSIRDIFLG